jgi:diaminopimelate decarboxylase
MSRDAEMSESKCCGTCGCKSTCAVSPRVDALTASVLRERSLLLQQIQSKGSPLNVVMPQTVIRNHEAFVSVLSRNSIRGEVLFTSKPNKSKAILSSLALRGASVDVSSEGALAHALECGVKNEHLQCSGPKSREYLSRALLHGTILSIDSFDEFDHMCQLLASNRNLPDARFFIRISGFQSDRIKFAPSDAPFGIRFEKIRDALERAKNVAPRARFEGIHFHLLSGDREERLVAFENALEGTQQAQKMGLRPRGINIGGGFKIQYAAHAEEWQRFQSYLRASVLGKVKPVTWDGSGLGFRAEAGRIVGAAAFADHYPQETGPAALESFLSQRSPVFDHCTVGELLRDMMLELRVEPGRALLDCAGITACEINAVKESASGQPLLMLNMNHSNLLSREQKLLTQPIFIPSGQRAPSTQSYFLFGNLCIASDLIQYQKVYPEFEPQRGDVVIFVNTAAYLMDFAEAELLHQPTAKKIVALEGAQGLSFCEDRCLSAEEIRMEGHL